MTTLDGRAVPGFGFSVIESRTLRSYVHFAGNGIIVNRSYDAVTGWIDYIRCGVGGGACSQNNSYTFDKVGNLTQRQNANLNLTENFFYDSVNRLDYSQLNGQTNLDMTYDNLGNITNRTDVANNATWTYDLTRKHQVLAAGSNSYAYDQNGNATSRNGSSISWTSYNYPSQITGPGETINLFYDANRQRYKQVYSYNGNVETTFYIGGLTQKVSMNGNDDYRYTITANGKTVAIMSCGTGHVCANGPSNLTRYVLSDNQGSVAKFTDSSGNAIVSESFTAFGARRNPQTWSGQPTYGDQQTISGISREGYTGHTALGNLGLNHMNGRVQDAVTGRFISADPYITEPGNTQNYNRYSYVYNNPMTFTDPNGFECIGEANDGCTLSDVDVAAEDPPDIPTIDLGVWNFSDTAFALYDGGANLGGFYLPSQPERKQHPCPPARAIARTFSEDTALRRAALAKQNAAADLANVLLGLGGIAAQSSQSVQLSNSVIRGTIGYKGFDGGGYGGGRSFPADTGAQVKAYYGQATALNTAGAVLNYAGAAYAAGQLIDGYRTGDDNGMFNGLSGLVAAGAGAINPIFGVSVALTLVAASDGKNDKSSVLDRVTLPLFLGHLDKRG